MVSRVKIRGFGLAFLLIICNCPSLALDSETYVGHLQLDNSTLIITEVLGNLDTVAWEITAAADGWLWFTQQSGTVNRANPATGEVQHLLTIPDVYYKKSFGLLGMALHPKFAQQPYVFVHYTYRKSAPGTEEMIRSRLVRYHFANGILASPTVLLNEIPGAGYHNGSRILITPDEKLLLTTGDAGDPSASQGLDTLRGKVLRMTLDGSTPPDNPFSKRSFPTSLIWSFGHRNSQGIALAANGVLYTTDHGANTDDEINIIKPGGNYGWPKVAGFCDQSAERKFCKQRSVTEPLIAWTPTIATAGLIYFDHPSIPEWQHSLLVATMKGRSLRVLNLNEPGTAVTAEHIFFQKRFGRIRDLAVDVEGTIYLSTTNTDWHPRYQPWMYDSLPTGGDRILRISAANAAERKQLLKLQHPNPLVEDKQPMALAAEDWTFSADADDLTRGKKLYATHCRSCHGPEGQGAVDLVPPLTGSDWVSGDRSRLIQVLLRGLSGPITVNNTTYDQEMPSFASLSNKNIAAILTYIRNNFGNNGNAILEGEVFEERKVVN